MKQKPRTLSGICKLTGAKGKFVDAHLIPRAFTRPREAGHPFIQGGKGTRPGLRWNGWYDQQLVIRKGEDILETLDTWAARELRNNELVWGGWGPARALSNVPEVLAEDGRGFREIHGLDPDKLRLFFLSLLWRAAASGRPEFSEVSIPDADLERLRLMLVENNPHPLSFYATMLLQFSTLGPSQNLSPFSEIVDLLNEDMTVRKTPIFRFYFDGLASWTIRNATDQRLVDNYGNIIVGHGSTLRVPTTIYEGSFQDVNGIRGFADSITQHPHDMMKMLRPKLRDP